MPRRWIMVSLVALLVRASVVAAAPTLAGSIVDLTHAFDDRTIYWPTEPGFTLEHKHAEVTDQGYFYASKALCTPEHGGTHVDAPLHFWKDGAAVDAIPLERLIAPAVLVDVTVQVQRDRDYRVTATHVALFRRGVPAFENVANLDKLPVKGFTVVALPMKIRGGSGGPLRIVAILEQ